MFVSVLWSGAFASMLGACAAGDELDLLERSSMAPSQPAFEGRFETRIAIWPDGTERTIHVLVASAQELTISLDASVEIPRDAVVRVWGSELEDGVLEVDSYEIVAWPPQPLIDAEPRPHRRVATVLLVWEGAMQINNPTARERMFTDSDSTHALYGESSYGIEKIAGNVFGPYEIEQPESCDAQQIATLGMNAFLERGHQQSDYRQFMWVFPGGLGCGWASLGSNGTPDMPGRDSWYNGSFGCMARSKTLGFNFGLPTSGVYTQCTDDDGFSVPYSDNCDAEHANDPYDFMGQGCAHPNVVQKTRMGWLDDCNVVRATADGTFNLLPTELPCNGTQALRFPTYDGRDYWLEYRRPLGFSNVSGVLVRVSGEVVFGASTTPFLLGMGTDWFLPVGEPYTDPGGTVTFTVVEQHPTHAVISATFPDGGSGEPVCRNRASPEVVEGAVGVLECADAPFPLDSVPPSVEIVAPEDGSVFEPGASFDLVAEASDDRGVTELELFVSIDGGDATRMGGLVDPSEGCEGAPGQVCPWVWSLSDVPAGRYEFGVRAWDGPNWTDSWEVAGKTHVIQVGDEPGADETGDGQGETGDGPDETAGDTAGDTEGETSHSDAVDEGCACRSGTSDEMPTWLAWLVLAGLGARRRCRTTGPNR
jgi:MYXO-CTERM domain-containing protein